MDPSLADPFAARARYAIAKHHARHLPKLEGQPLPPLEKLVALNPVTAANPVCIVGAGVAGLYTAMILQSLNIPYTILEVSGFNGETQRVGGRLFTSTFKQNTSGYEYYDVGAMRFPKTAFMKRTFELAALPAIQSKAPMIPYSFSSANTWEYFNGQQVAPSTNAPDPYNIGPSGYLPTQPKDWSYLLNPANLQTELETIMKTLKAPFTESSSIADAMNTLMTTYDQYSMRSYLESLDYPSEVINIMETFDKSTGWYDRALTESVCESLAFEGVDPTPNSISYFCFNKGSSQLPIAMQSTLPNNAIQFSTKVVSISYPQDGSISDGLVVTSQVASQSGGAVQTVSTTYGAVIATVPFGRLSLIDMSGAGIYDNYAQWSAIRELQYGPAIKIGIQFTANWWSQLNISGGQSYTDLPVRTVVYPSYPQEGIKSDVLIASYCWTQDAERLGALMDGKGGASQELIDRVIRDLTAIHGGQDALAKLTNPHIPGGDLSKLVNDVFAWDWLHDPNTMGGYAFFGPGQFTDEIYPQVTKAAASGQLYFAGEACSACHAWVAGALESAWSSVALFLKAYGYSSDIYSAFTAQWGQSVYWDDEEQLETHLRLGLYQAKRAREVGNAK